MSRLPVDAPPVPFSGALLAGGYSTRMGRDKSLLPMPDGRPLWLHQVEKLAAAGASEVLLCCRPGQQFQMPDEMRLRLPPVRTIHDGVADCGPLAGLAAALANAAEPLVLALAVDLPDIQPAHMRTILEFCADGCGAVPERAGFFEPLFAAYPRTLRDAAAAHLAQKQLSLQDFVRAAVAAGSVRIVPAGAELSAALRNVNTPSDLPAV